MILSAALMLERDPQASPDEVKRVIVENGVRGAVKGAPRGDRAVLLNVYCLLKADGSDESCVLDGAAGNGDVAEAVVSPRGTVNGFFSTFS